MFDHVKEDFTVTHNALEKLYIIFENIVLNQSVTYTWNIWCITVICNLKNRACRELSHIMKCTNKLEARRFELCGLWMAGFNDMPTDLASSLLLHQNAMFQPHIMLLVSVIQC